MAKILGLDVSSANTGHCIINNGRLIKSTLGSIIPEKKNSLGGKLQYFERELIKLLQKHNPDYVIIEDIFRGPNIITFKTLAMFRGVCFKAVYDKLGKDPICIMPTAARKLVGTDGVTKENGFDFVIEKYALPGYEFDTHNDITDSIVLALAGHTMQKLGLSEKDLKSKKKKRKKRKKRKK